MTVGPSLRERRRSQTVREIKQAALRQLSGSGSMEMSLRAVAREVGISVQGLYHYYENRDALLTVLARDAHEALAVAVQEAADGSRGQPVSARRLAVARAYRRWALAERPSFLLVYGTPVAGFDPRRDEATVAAAWRLAAPFADVMFDGWTPTDLAAVRAPADMVTAAPEMDPRVRLPLGALVVFTETRALMHGLVMLELLGYEPLRGAGAVFFDAAIQRVSDELDTRLAAGRR